MSLLYYENINYNKAKTIFSRTYDALLPFYQYLTTAISSMKKREIEANWHHYQEDVMVLKPLHKIYRIMPITHIQLQQNEPGWYFITPKEPLLYDWQPNFEDSIVVSSKRKRWHITPDDFRINFSNISNEKNSSVDNQQTMMIRLPYEDANLGIIRWGDFDEFDTKPAWNDVKNKKYSSLYQKDRSLTILSQEGINLVIQGLIDPDEVLIDEEENPVKFHIISEGNLKEYCNRYINESRNIDKTQQTNESKLSQQKTSSSTKLSCHSFFILKENTECWVVATTLSLKETKTIKINPENDLEKYITISHLYYSDTNQEFPLKNKMKGLTFRIENGDSYVGKRLTTSGIEFEIAHDESDDISEKEENKYWIQLEEIEKDIDETSGLSPLRYFFDDDIEIEDNCRNNYDVVQRYEDEYRLVLKRNGKHCLPEGNILRIRVNTYQLRMQEQAVQTLQNMPIREQSKLIRLFELRKITHWDTQWNNTTIIRDWQVLTDLRYSGTSEQREFVQKALDTPDFALMEGPPGSGKTTVILELIWQIISRNQRVLLCASTHVAIDNVLERLKERNILSNILPVRIGDAARISEDVREFQLNSMMERYNISQNLLLDSANLVCGTTIGILQHPLFKDRERIRNKNGYGEVIEPIMPEFDYLIIDESSKTTFQEFLIPALYAKKWILVGDIQQLSPYTERECIVSNLESLNLKNGHRSISLELQQACFLLQKFLKEKIPCFVVCKHNVLKELWEECQHRIQNKKFPSDKIIFIIAKAFQKNTERSDQNQGKLHLFPPSQLNSDALELAIPDIIFCGKEYAEEVLKVLPEKFLVIGDQDWSESIHAYRHNCHYRHNYQYRERKHQLLTDSFEIVKNFQEYLKEKSWAEEVAWRLIRIYELRLLQRDQSKMQQDLDDLMPTTVDIEYYIETIQNIALPSVLEGLRQGIKGRRKQEPSTITSGFSTEELRARHTMLSFQHRMHPEISDFPRKTFYKDQALKDAEYPINMAEKRIWSYPRYCKRRIWLNVDGYTKRNYNNDEVSAIERELLKFTEWAKNHPPQHQSKWEVACLSFYRGQETRLRYMLQRFCHQPNKISRFQKDGVAIYLYTVDRFQGQEADLIFLSMVQTKRDGFLDSPNRLNVAITRARYQLVIVGKYSYFRRESRSEELLKLAEQTEFMNGISK